MWDFFVAFFADSTDHAAAAIHFVTSSTWISICPFALVGYVAPFCTVARGGERGSEF